MTKAKPTPPSKAKAAKTPAEAAKSAAEKSRASRETVESIVIAVILAFLFRAFEAEAFVIPTGSMAPTLQGRHGDIECPKCKYRYQAGASSDQNDTILTHATCPICRYTTKPDMALGWITRAEDGPFDGDRILVSKFAYELSDPQRWDVIVFKYPGNAKVNYIKRLVGLPGERVRIQYGNLYVRTKDEAKFTIARKSPEKVVAMLQLVDDTQHIPADLDKAGWPLRWRLPNGDAPDKPWTVSKQESSGKISASFSAPDDSAGETWLRYRHLVPSLDDWEFLEAGQAPPHVKQVGGQLITDFYAYNCGAPNRGRSTHVGQHWVRDLALECEAKIESDTGELLLDLVKGGVHYQCRIDVASGSATLSIDGGFEEFQSATAVAKKLPAAQTPLKRKGTYRLRFANVDDQLFLWVNGRSITRFDEPTTYGKFRVDEPANVRPVSNEQDAGDLAPAGVGTKGAAVTFSKLRVLRDVYYIADNDAHRGEEFESYSDDILPQVLSTPSQWGNHFRAHRPVEFPDDGDRDSYFGPDQFFPCGDNSPASQDARIWTDRQNSSAPAPNHYVERKLLIGKALLIYWPHTWNRPVPFTPNPQRMKFIR